MEEKPRYSRTSDILDLLILMQAKIQGVSLSDIQNYYGVSRRTAERMRDSIIFSVPQVEELPTNSREKRWGFNNASLKEIINFTPDELANLENMKKFQEENGFEDKAKILENTINKIRALSRKQLGKLENEIELLLQSEGFAVKQMPKYNIDLDILSVFREAMKNNLKVKAKYNGKDKLISPYGLIYGEKIYLIAVEEEKGNNPYNYLLHKFSYVELTKDIFDKGDFDLDSFSKISFGVYHGEPYDVKLLFSKTVKDDVLAYHFHPTQKMKENDDGSVTVKFRASGSYEILWHLFKWGDSLKILAPRELKKEYIEMLKRTIENQG